MLEILFALKKKKRRRRKDSSVPNTSEKKRTKLKRNPTIYIELIRLEFFSLKQQKEEDR